MTRSWTLITANSYTIILTPIHYIRTRERTLGFLLRQPHNADILCPAESLDQAVSTARAGGDGKKDPAPKGVDREDHRETGHKRDGPARWINGVA